MQDMLLFKAATRHKQPTEIRGHLYPTGDCHADHIQYDFGENKTKLVINIHTFIKGNLFLHKLISQGDI